MLVIRMQRTGRSGHAQFRVVVQDSRTAPSSGKVVARLGSYDPHTKTAQIDKDKVEFYLKNGARPSDRAAGLFKTEKIKLPEWFTPNPTKKSETRNTEKLRRNRPAEEKVEEPKVEETPAEETPAETTEETPKEETAEAPAEAEAEEKPAEEPAAETPEEAKE